MENMTVFYNQEKNGIEVRFVEKPETVVLACLKANGFRWSNRQKMWYASKNDQTVDAIKSLSEGVISFDCKNNTENKEYNLFAMTRTDSIGNNVDKDADIKSIAVLVRKHIKPRFPMCRFSVTSDYNSINVSIKSSPFEKGSEALKAVCDYVNAYVESFRYCTCYDPYGDYGSSYSFYYFRCNASWDYVVSDMTVSMAGICETFEQEKQAFEQAEYERRKMEWAEQEKQRRIEHEKAEALRLEAEAKRDEIQRSVTEKPVEYFVEGLLDCGISKRNSDEEYAEDRYGERTTCTCKVTKEIHMNREQYDFFRNALLMDWSFIAKTGGSETADLRINGIVDFEMMDASERATVDWYSIDCVAIFCDDELMFVVDAQGYDYCRYVYFVCDNTRIVEKHQTSQAISVGEAEQNGKLAETLVDASAKLIIENGLSDWSDEQFDIYRGFMERWMTEHGFVLTVGIVRAIPEQYEPLKRAMYKLLRLRRGTRLTPMVTNLNDIMIDARNPADYRR